MLPSLTGRSLQLATLLSQLRDHLYPPACPTHGTDTFGGNGFFCLYVSLEELFPHPPTKYEFLFSNMNMLYHRLKGVMKKVITF